MKTKIVDYIVRGKIVNVDTYDTLYLQYEHSLDSVRQLLFSHSFNIKIWLKKLCIHIEAFSKLPGDKELFIVRQGYIFHDVTSMVEKPACTSILEEIKQYWTNWFKHFFRIQLLLYKSQLLECINWKDEGIGWEMLVWAVQDFRYLRSEQTNHGLKLKADDIKDHHHHNGD